MYSLKFRSYGMALSPIRMCGVLPIIKTFCINTGYSEASSVSPTFYNKHGKPSRMAFSIVFIKRSLEALQICKLSFLWILRIHVFACPCGSISKGHVRALVKIIAFYVDSASVGNSHNCHYWICTASPQVSTRPTRSLQVIRANRSCSIHFSCNALRY